MPFTSLGFRWWQLFLSFIFCFLFFGRRLILLLWDWSNRWFRIFFWRLRVFLWWILLLWRIFFLVFLFLRYFTWRLLFSSFCFFSRLFTFLFFSLSFGTISFFSLLFFLLFGLFSFLRFFGCLLFSFSLLFFIC